MPDYEVYAPDDTEPARALARTTHLALGAHHDDLEIMAFDAIAACYDDPASWFTGVVVTDGRGAPRSGTYAEHTDDEIAVIRRDEQKEAARIGRYGAQLLMDFRSAEVKDSANSSVVEAISDVLEACSPHTVYTHNLADKHDTHVAVALRVITALRLLPLENRPERLLGCEVWRDLDWLDDDDKILLDCSAHDRLQRELVNCFRSQVDGGKRYDAAVPGRRAAHATFADPYAPDERTGVAIAMDLTPLIRDHVRNPADFVAERVARFASDVQDRIDRLA